MEGSVQFGRRELGLDLEASDFLNGHLQRGSYDVVTMWATLEHLADPSSFVAEAARVLRPGGLLALSVPNTRSLSHLILRQRDRYLCVEHLNYFTQDTMSQLLRRHGYIIRRAITRKINPKTVVQDLLSNPEVERMPSELLSDQVATDRVKTARMLAPVRFGHRVLERGLAATGLGDLLLILAQRP